MRNITTVRKRAIVGVISGHEGITANGILRCLAVIHDVIMRMHGKYNILYIIGCQTGFWTFAIKWRLSCFFAIFFLPYSYIVAVAVLGPSKVGPWA
jgi:hypothetical protein